MCLFAHAFVCLLEFLVCGMHACLLQVVLPFFTNHSCLLKRNGVYRIYTIHSQALSELHGLTAGGWGGVSMSLESPRQKERHYFQLR